MESLSIPTIERISVEYFVTKAKSVLGFRLFQITNQN